MPVPHEPQITALLLRDLLVPPNHGHSRTSACRQLRHEHASAAHVEQRPRARRKESVERLLLQPDRQVGGGTDWAAACR
jgi:hypothetical protein